MAAAKVIPFGNLSNPKSSGQDPDCLVTRYPELTGDRIFGSRPTMATATKLIPFGYLSKPKSSGQDPDYLVTRNPELTGHRIFGSSPTYNIHGGGGKSNNHLESYLNHPLDSQMVSYPVFNCCRTTPRALALQTWQTKLIVTDLIGFGSIPQDL